MAPSSSSSSQNSRSRRQAESSRAPTRDAAPLPAGLRDHNSPSSTYISPYSPVTTVAKPEPPTIISPQPTQPARAATNPLLSQPFPADYQVPTTAMSTYSSSSQDSIYSSPGPHQYAVVTPGMMNNPQGISQVSQCKRYVTFWSFLYTQEMLYT